MQPPALNPTTFCDTGAYGPALGDAEFEFIRHVVGENAGIVLGPNKRQLVQGRLARRLRDLGLRSYEEYCEYLRRSGPEELVGLINALTTNVTSFFRENHHFEALRHVHAAGSDGAQRRVAPHPHLVRGLLDRRGAVLHGDDRRRTCCRAPAGTARFSRPTSTAT